MAPRMTVQVQLVLQLILDHPHRRLYGQEISDALGLPTGTLIPILRRFEGLGWLSSDWEDVDPKAEGRPRRRYYQMTEDGAHDVRHALLTARTPVTRLLPGKQLGTDADR